VCRGWQTSYMKTSVVRSMRFEAAHHLPWHPGACSRVHGHSYSLEVAVSGDLDERGVVLDFDDLGAVLAAEVSERFDHRDLNEVLDNPTAERIAQRIWVLLEPIVPGLDWLRLWETPDCSVVIQR
jgi:6-pyruvoyltetrahydropterin/6-carboxytetrahydropterin synthase